MRILQVINELYTGGAEKLVTEISILLRDRGHKVDVCSFLGTETDFKRQLKDAGINVISFIDKGFQYNPIFILKLSKLMRNYDIVHTHNTGPQMFAAIASLWNSCEVIYTEHNTTNKLRTLPVFYYIFKWINSRYKKIICISDKAEYNLHKYIPSLKNLCTIYNGVDVQKFYYATPIEGMKTEGKTIVAMVAAFRPQKDHDTLFKAFQMLPKDKYELWVIGDGPRHKEIYNKVKELNINDVVKFFGVRTDVPEILHTADIIVMSSHYEGLSLSSVEGMSVGKPFVATDVDGLKEVVDGYGVMVPHQDAKALASEIIHLTKDKVYYQKVSDQCWNRAQMFDIKKMVDSYEQVYLSFLRK